MDLSIAVVVPDFGPEPELRFDPESQFDALVSALKLEARVVVVNTLEATDCEVFVVDVNAATGQDADRPVILSSALRPLAPWSLPLEAEERAALMPLWGKDLEARQERSRQVRGEGYADDARAILAAAKALAHPSPVAGGPGLTYLGALFNELPLVVGTKLPLPVGKDAILGRAKNAALLLQTPNLSRHHLRFHAHPDGALTTTDLGGSNGNWLCRLGEPALRLPFAPIDLSHDDELAIAGDFRFRYWRE